MGLCALASLYGNYNARYGGITPREVEYRKQLRTQSPLKLSTVERTHLAALTARLSKPLSFPKKYDEYANLCRRYSLSSEMSMLASPFVSSENKKMLIEIFRFCNSAPIAQEYMLKNPYVYGNISQNDYDVMCRQSELESIKMNPEKSIRKEF